MKSNNNKIITILLTLILVLSLGNFTNATNFSNNETQKHIDYLLTSDNPEDHIKAIQLMELIGHKTLKSEVTVYDVLNNMSTVERKKYEQEIIDEVNNLSLING